MVHSNISWNPKKECHPQLHCDLFQRMVVTPTSWQSQ